MSALIAKIANSRGWIFSAKEDFIVFSLPILFGIGLFHLLQNVMYVPALAYVMLIYSLALDTPHTYSTFCRTHFNDETLRTNPKNLIYIPLAIYFVLLGLHSISPQVMWRVLVYMVAWHFIRQQIGWVNWTAQKAKDRTPLNTFFDHMMIYTCTLYPLILWHTPLVKMTLLKDRPFYKVFPVEWIPVFETIYWSVIALYVLVQIHRISKSRRINFAKYQIVFTTWFAWYLGVLLYRSEVALLIIIAAAHGLPYLYLNWTHLNVKSANVARWKAGSAVAIFLAVLWVLSFGERILTQVFVSHERDLAIPLQDVFLSSTIAFFIIPLSAMPAACHLVYDTYVWRRRYASSALNKILDAPEIKSADRVSGPRQRHAG